MYETQGGSLLGSVRRLMLSLMLIVVGIAVLAVLLLAAIDYQCGSEIDRWLPIYPGAVLLEETHDYFRPRAMGRTNAEYYTPDDRDAVLRWYSEYRRNLTSGQYNEANPNARLESRSVATVRYTVRAADDGGTIIITYSECAY